MAWFGLSRLFKRSTQPRGAHVFDDEDRELAKAKQLQKAIQRQELEALEDRLQSLKQMRERRILEEQINNMEEELYDEEDEEEEDDKDDPDTVLMSMLSSIMAGQQPQQQQPQQQTKKRLTDEELQALKEKIPSAYLKKAKTMSDEELINFAKIYKPDIFTEYDEDTLQRALILIKT